MIKCVGCYDLLREEIEFKDRPLVVYNCPRFFPYATAISGLIRPGKGIVEAARDCPERLDEHCVLCANTDGVTYGIPYVFICKEHSRAWGNWLDQHPERRAYLAPKGRARQANWIEVFREFIEDMRQEAEGTP